MSHRTYSFEDVVASFTAPGVVGNASTTGAGVGSISIAMANDVTAHDVAADGTVMVSKMKRRNGTINLAIQQTSALHAYLLRWYNYIENERSSLWADMKITIQSKNLAETITCTGVSPQKIADRNYEAQGGQVTWSLMSAEITHK